MAATIVLLLPSPFPTFAFGGDTSVAPSLGLVLVATSVEYVKRMMNRLVLCSYALLARSSYMVSFICERNVAHVCTCGEEIETSEKRRR